MALVTVALGSAAFVALRCVVTHLVPASNLGTLYTAMGLVQNIGIMASGPFLAASFKAGLKIRVPGLPYLLVAGLLSLFFVATVVTPLPKDQLAARQEGGDEEHEETQEAVRA